MWAVAVKAIGSVIVFDAAGIQVFDLPKALFSRAMAWLLVALIALAVYRYGRAIVPLTRLHLLPLVFVMAALVSTVLAQNTYIAVFGEFDRYLGLTFILDMAVLYCAAAIAVRTPKDWLVLFGAIVVAAGLTFAYALLQRLGLDPVHWDQDALTRPFSTLGNADMYGTFLSVTYAVGLAIGLYQSNSRPVRVIGAALAVLSLVFISIVATRASLIGVGAATVVVGAIYLRLHRRLSLVRGAAIVLAAIGVLTILYVATPLGERVRVTIAGANIRDRVLIYEAAINEATDRPVFGYGPDNFGAAYPRYRPVENNLFNLPGQPQSSAHSWFFNTAATLGLVGLSALLAMIIVFALVLWRALPTAPGPAAAALAASAAYWGSSIVAVGSNGVDWAPWLSFGAAVAIIAPHGVDVRPVRRLDPIGIGVVLAIAVVVMVTGSSAVAASRSALQANAAITRKDATAAIAAAQKAVDSDPGRAHYWETLGRAFTLNKRWADAADAFSNAARRTPHETSYSSNLAKALLFLAEGGDTSKGGTDAALETARASVRTDPNNPSANATVGLIAARVGAYDEALAAYAQASILYPPETAWDAPMIELAKRTPDRAHARALLESVLRARDRAPLRDALATLAQ